jgi:hypothetical protein
MALRKSRRDARSTLARLGIRRLIPGSIRQQQAETNVFLRTLCRFQLARLRKLTV